MTEPTQEEWAQAKALLAASAREICVLQLGGQRPVETRLASWWGGNFIADAPAPGLLPLIQIRVADLPEAFRGAFRSDYLLFWLAADPDLGELIEGRDFAIQELPTPEDPPAPAEKHNLDGGLALFQLHPLTGRIQRPSWEDFADKVPRAVARSREGDWFFGHTNEIGDDDLAVLIGGWPQWIQGEQTPKDAEFVLQVVSTYKGKLNYGDSGNLYLFRGPDAWQLKGDFY